MKDRRPKKYELNQSPFYMLESKDKLASILSFSDYKSLSEFLDRGLNYRIFTTLDTKKRKIEAPRPTLEKLHNRIFALLKRIEVPDYLHSGVKGRSYVTNAAVHQNPCPLLTMDIKNFYPSTKKKDIVWFFSHTMKCSVDVAATMGRICSCDGHLPTGSALSQILAYFCHMDLFDDLHFNAKLLNLVMTLYVDDLTFSGERLTREWAYTNVKEVISRRGLQYHKERFYSGADSICKCTTQGIPHDLIGCPVA